MAFGKLYSYPVSPTIDVWGFRLPMFQPTFATILWIARTTV